MPPQIALDVTRVVMCADRVARLLRCCDDISVVTAVEHLLPALQRNLARDLRYVLVSAATELVARHTCSQRPSADRVRDAIGDTFDAATPAGNLDATIADLVAQGVDGERVTWEVITRESIKHEGLIHKECNRLVRTLPDRHPDELKGYGWHGLRIALRNFSPELGFAFSTYACPKINGAIRDGVRAESPIPKRLTTFVRKVTKAEEHLTHTLARIPTYAEISAYVDSTSESLHLLPRLAPAASLEELALTSAGDSREPACLIDSADPEAAAMTALRDEALHNAVDSLPHDDAQAIRLLLLEEMPVGEAAALVGIEPRQLRLRKQRGLKALEPVMRAWMDENIFATA